jgi:flavin reductase (DIM6/NTAB) family NADH-FMN oxidoreductase RutF
MPVATQSYKDILARWSSGVTIVTTVYENQWKGITVSSFSSVSLTPPLILICLGKKLYTHGLVRSSGVFAVNILTESQLALGKLFAGMHPDIKNRFEGLNCFTAETGSPIIPDTLGWLDCKVVAHHDAGDHTIYIGEVLQVAASVRDDARPLLYHNRKWGVFETNNVAL